MTLASPQSLRIRPLPLFRDCSQARRRFRAMQNKKHHGHPQTRGRGTFPGPRNQTRTFAEQKQEPDSNTSPKKKISTVTVLKNRAPILEGGLVESTISSGAWPGPPRRTALHGRQDLVIRGVGLLWKPPVGRRTQPAGTAAGHMGTATQRLAPRCRPR